MAKITKCTAALISLLISCCVSAVTVNAVSNSQSAYNGEIVLTDEENEAYFNSLSIEEQEKAKEKMLNALNGSNNASRTNNLDSITATKISIPGTFVNYHQENDYYCVPACVQSILAYINGSSPSQLSIALSLGTTFLGTEPTTIAPYLNSKQNVCYYIYNANPTQSLLCNAIYNTITNDQCPASIGISGATTSNWYYNTNGHSLVVNAIYDDYSSIQLADPLAGSVIGCPDFYTKSASTVSSLCTRVVY